ncbi:PaaI family thioesterase [Sporomusa termitida]|uniref:1,4-dihydroxy-2-naphthoyl-CoA hydrolase n=1 Tax=Sporomusa termitida TaxID=2377 RepID=A0A517DRC7_9FIRM|nr:PaaI family thioesterase [Sporomusa termitida]QDR79910.1 1,4-dihydroxy-2-naphthoyl-CoA hydrolase [Sporomusa termitida]
MVSSSNLIDSLNIEYIRVQGDTLEAKMNLTRFHSQPFGYLHGGATIAFGETVAGYASNQKIAGDQAAVGQTITANHLKPKKTTGYIVARGRLLQQGRHSHVWLLEMVDETNAVIAHMTVANAIVGLNKVK